MPTDFLGFGDWIRQSRQDHHWSPGRIADNAGVPRTTLSAFLSPQRHLQRPSRSVAMRVTASMKLPSLAMAVVAGYADRDEFGQAEEPIISNVLSAWGRQKTQRRSLLWSTAGARYLKVVAESAGLDLSLTRERWHTRTGDSVTDTDWESSFQYGYIPEHWTPGKMLDTLPGPAIGLLTESMGGDAIDIIGVAAVMGRIGPGLASEWGCEKDYTAWVAVVESQGWGQSGDFDAVVYREAVREIDWTIPPVPDAPRESFIYGHASVSGKEFNNGGQSGDTEDLAFLLARYPKLAPGQKSIIRQLISSWLPD